MACNQKTDNLLLISPKNKIQIADNEKDLFILAEEKSNLEISKIKDIEYVETDNETLAIIWFVTKNDVDRNIGIHYKNLQQKSANFKDEPVLVIGCANDCCSGHCNINYEYIGGSIVVNCYCTGGAGDCDGSYNPCEVGFTHR